MTKEVQDHGAALFGPSSPSREASARFSTARVGGDGIDGRDGPAARCDSASTAMDGLKEAGGRKPMRPMMQQAFSPRGSADPRRQHVV